MDTVLIAINIDPRKAAGDLISNVQCMSLTREFGLDNANCWAEAASDSCSSSEHPLQTTTTRRRGRSMASRSVQLPSSRYGQGRQSKSWLSLRGNTTSGIGCGLRALFRSGHWPNFRSGHWPNPLEGIYGFGPLDPRGFCRTGYQRDSAGVALLSELSVS